MSHRGTGSFRFVDGPPPSAPDEPDEDEWLANLARFLAARPGHWVEYDFDTTGQAGRALAYFMRRRRDYEAETRRGTTLYVRSRGALNG